MFCTVNELKWNWAGHVARRKDEGWPKYCLPGGQWSGRGRQPTRWRDDICRLAGVTGTTSARKEKLAVTGRRLLLVKCLVSHNVFRGILFVS